MSDVRCQMSEEREKDEHRTSNIEHPTSNEKQKKILWLALILWMILIMALNSVPGSDLPSAGDASIDFFVRQGGHVFLHMILACFAWMVAKESWKGRRAWIIAVCIAAVFSMFNEFYQRLIPGRNPNWEDVGYNLFGVFLIMSWVAYRYRRQTRQVRTFLN